MSTGCIAHPVLPIWTLKNACVCAAELTGRPSTIKMREAIGHRLLAVHHVRVLRRNNSVLQGALVVKFNCLKSRRSQFLANQKDGARGRRFAFNTVLCRNASPRTPRDGIQNGLRAGAQVGPQSGFGRTVKWAGFDNDTTINLGEEGARHAEISQDRWETTTWRRPSSELESTSR